MLRGITVIILWIAMLASAPQTNLHIACIQSEVQEILLPALITAAPPAFIVKTTIEHAEFISAELSKTDIEKHLHITAILDRFLSEYARALTRAFIYTQTTSSFL